MYAYADINRRLIYAVRDGNLEMVRDLIDACGLSQSSGWADGYVLLCDALKHGKGAVAKLLLRNGCKIESKNSKIKPCDTALHFAVRYGDTDIIAMILNRADNVDAKNRYGTTPLHAAIKYNELEITQLLLRHGADVDATEDKGLSSLHFAVQSANVEIVKLLLENGAQVDRVSFADRYAPVTGPVEDGITPLHMAATRGYTPIAEELLKFGACLHSTTWQDESTPLHLATEGGHEAIVKLLLEHGAKVDDQQKDGKTALYLAMKKGYLKIVEDLLKHGANVNVVNTSYNNFTPLHAAVKNRHEEITKLLISYEADINAQDKHGKTPIFYAIENADANITNLLLSHTAHVKNSPELLCVAVEKKCMEIIEALLQQDVDVNAIDRYGRTALHSTAFIGCEDMFNFSVDEHPDDAVRGEIAKLLLSKGANINSRMKTGATTLHGAAEKGYTKLAEALLEYNANVNSVRHDDVTPLHLSVRSKNKEICIMLLNKGADVNAQEQDGSTALHLATGNGDEVLVKLLLEYSAKVEYKTKNHITPLLMAAERGYQGITEIILKYGADIDCRDNYGRTALHLASRKGYTNIVLNLLEYGSDINITDAVSPCKEIVRVFERHIVKMKTANLYVSEQNLRSISWTYKMSEYKEECEEEIAGMKSEKIHNANISFYDILIKHTSSLAMYMRNENIVQVLKSDAYKKKCPIYASMIECHFRKSMERKELLEQGNNIFHLFFPDLPYDCSEKIFRYLSDKDLRTLIDASKPLGISNPDTNINDVMITSNVSQIQYA